MSSQFRQNMLLAALVSAGLGWVACPAVLAQAAPPSAAGAYNVDLASSRIYVRLDSATRMGHAHGIRGQLASGAITFNGTGQLLFDMRTFTADTRDARQYVGLDPEFSGSDAQKVTANMHGSSVLDVASYPRASFAITSIQPLDRQAAGEPGRYQVDGRFTLRGTTRPIQFAAKLAKGTKPGTLHWTGSFTVNQTSFGIQPYSALGGLVRVADSLQIFGDLVLVPVGRAPGR